MSKFLEYAKLAGGLVLSCIFASSQEDFEYRQAMEEEKKKEEQRRKEREEAERKEQELLATMTPEEKRLYLLEKEVKELKSDNRSLRRRLNSVESECESQQNTIRDLESQIED